MNKLCNLGKIESMPEMKVVPTPLHYFCSIIIRLQTATTNENMIKSHSHVSYLVVACPIEYVIRNNCHMYYL